MLYVILANKMKWKKWKKRESQCNCAVRLLKKWIGLSYTTVKQEAQDIDRTELKDVKKDTEVVDNRQK